MLTLMWDLEERRKEGNSLGKKTGESKILRTWCSWRCTLLAIWCSQVGIDFSVIKLLPLGIKKIIPLRINFATYL